MSGRTISIPTAEVFAPLLEPARYKAVWGGRGSGKSYNFADMLIRWCLVHPGTRWLCVREIQKSLKESAKFLIESELERFGLGERDGFRKLDDRIIAPGNGVIVFAGMQDHTAESIKSYEGFDGAWVEEAQSLSDRSMTLLRPTIRAEGSEIWLGWNPRRKSDPVEQIFRQGQPPTGSIVIRANWSDNPWFPAVLDQERRDCLANDPDNYEHIWEGGYQVVVKGAYYAQALARARTDGRIGFYPPDPLMTYRVSVDIGGVGAKADAFSMWVAQWIGREIRLLNAYEAQGQEAGEHIAWLRANGYTPGRATIYLPHDGSAQKGPTRGSWETTFRDAGYSVIIVPNQGAGAASKRIEAARRLFPRMTFNAKTTETGREAIGAYHEKIHKELGVGLGPEHDWASHSADAFGLMAVAYREPKPDKSRPLATPTV